MGEPHNGLCEFYKESSYVILSRRLCSQSGCCTDAFAVLSRSFSGTRRDLIAASYTVFHCLTTGALIYQSGVDCCTLRCSKQLYPEYIFDLDASWSSCSSKSCSPCAKKPEARNFQEREKSPAI